MKIKIKNNRSKQKLFLKHKFRAKVIIIIPIFVCSLDLYETFRIKTFFSILKVLWRYNKNKHNFHSIPTVFTSAINTVCSLSEFHYDRIERTFNCIVLSVVLSASTNSKNSWWNGISYTIAILFRLLLRGTRNSKNTKINKKDPCEWNWNKKRTKLTHRSAETSGKNCKCAL